MHKPCSKDKSLYRRKKQEREESGLRIREVQYLKSKNDVKGEK